MANPPNDEFEKGAPGQPAPPSSENERAEGVVRRYEVTVEREFLSISSPAGLHLSTRCPHCGKEVSVSVAAADTSQSATPNQAETPKSTTA